MKVVRVLQAAAAGALILAASGAAAQEGVLAKSILGSMGIIPKDKPPIEYRERPPLVVPQKLELRPPVNGQSVEARAPNWPRDPDVMARRAEEEEARRPVTEGSVYMRNRKNASLSPEEMRAGTRAGAGLPTEPAGKNADISTISPTELRAMDRRNRPQIASNEEPERRSLVQPPTGYRQPAPLRASVEPTPEDTSIFSGFRRWIGGDR